MSIRQIFGEIRLLVGNEGGFVHKKLLGVVRSVAAPITRALPIVSTIRTGIEAAGRVRSLIRGQQPGVPTQLMLPAGRVPARAVGPREFTARPSVAGEAEKQLGRAAKFGEAEIAMIPRPGIFGRARRRGFAPTVGITPPTIPGFGPGGDDCPSGTMRDPRGFCVSAISPVGAEAFGGEATVGRYGAAIIPGSQIVDRAVCMRGMQLGDDGLCYNRGQISNKQRMWPAGRKPLLSGGDMRAISVAARAGRRLEGATKRLQRLGMMKKPAPRRLPAGHRAKLVHQSEHGNPRD